MRTLIEALDQRVLLTDGSLARQFQGADLDEKRDLFGTGDCYELLNLTRARLVREVHEAYLRAGADVIRTNALAASPLSLERQGCADQAFYINFAAAQIACEAVDSVPGRGRRRFVLGVIRDHGWDLPPREVEEAVAMQAEGLLAGGVDGLALDLVPGTGRARIFLRGARRARENLSSSVPVFLHSARGETSFSPLNLELSDGLIGFRPGKADGRWLEGAIEREGLNLLGGGASPRQTAVLDRLLRGVAEDNLRPLTAWHQQKGSADEVVPPSSTICLDPAMAEVH